MLLRWPDLGTDRADTAHDSTIEFSGFVTAPSSAKASHCLLLPEAPCCVGCAPRDPLGAVEVFAASPLKPSGGLVRLTGTWRVRTDNENPWRYQLHDARLTEPAGWSAVSRRFVLGGAPLMCLAAVAAPRQAALAQQRTADARTAIDGMATVDIHSHAGAILRVLDGDSARLRPVAAPMTAGGMAAVCFAIVSDSPCHHVVGGLIRPYRSPEPGELYAWSQRGFARLYTLITNDRLAVITNPTSLNAARSGTPSAIIAAEGGDFLEGNVDRVDEAYGRWHLRHLQLTHYRVNELGDIQTEMPEHGGLTDFGAEVIRRCNRLGVVVDVAHGTYDLVKRAVSVTTKPLVLSHTSLTPRPGPRSRQISADHARLIAQTGGVIGVWPVQSIFHNLDGMAHGMARLAEVVGVDHVGLGSDMLGLVGPSLFGNYELLPDLAEAMLSAGFSVADVGKILGGNYARVFAATMG